MISGGKVEIFEDYWGSSRPSQNSHGLQNGGLEEKRRDDSQTDRDPQTVEPLLDRQQKLPPSRPRKSHRRFNISQHWLRRQAQELFTLSHHYASWIGFFGAVCAKLLDRIPEALLRATVFISPVARIISGLKMLKSSLFQPQGKWTRALVFVGGLCALSLGIAAILYPLFGFSFTTASISCNVVLSLWQVGCALKDKFRGTWKNEREELQREEEQFYSLLAHDKNLEKYLGFQVLGNRSALKHPALKQRRISQYLNEDSCLKLAALEHRIVELKNQDRQRNSNLAMKVHNLGLSLLALLGIILTLFPPTMIAGAIIILATNIHGLIFGSDLNGKWPQKAKNFFYPAIHFEPEKELREKLAAYKAAVLRKNAAASKTENPLSSTATTSSRLTLSTTPLRAASPGTAVDVEEVKSEFPVEFPKEERSLASTWCPQFWKRWVGSIKSQGSSSTLYMDILPTVHT